MVDKINDKFIIFCNECDWEEDTTGLIYEFCPKCGHVNIGFSKIRNDKNSKQNNILCYKLEGESYEYRI